MSTPPKKVEKLSTPTFLVICKDGPTAKHLRLEHLDGHLSHIEQNIDHYRIAGPMLNDEDSSIIGSYFLIKASSKAAVQTLLAGDPYFACGMYADIEYQRIVPACGIWIDGIIWDRDELKKNHPKIGR